MLKTKRKKKDHIPKRLHRIPYRSVEKRSYIEKLLYQDWKDGRITRAEYNKQLRKMQGR